MTVIVTGAAVGSGACVASGVFWAQAVSKVLAMIKTENTVKIIRFIGIFSSDSVDWNPQGRFVHIFNGGNCD
jgi:hypothetical protein